MCCLKAAQMNGLSFRATKELVKLLAPCLPIGKNILFLEGLSSLSCSAFNVLPPRAQASTRPTIQYKSKLLRNLMQPLLILIRQLNAIGKNQRSAEILQILQFQQY